MCSEGRFIDGRIAAIIIVSVLLILLKLLLLLLFVLCLLRLHSFAVHRSHGRWELNIAFLVQLIFELEEVGEDLVERGALPSDEVS